jgi:TP901 family phage tail tape measure protein
LASEAVLDIVFNGNTKPLEASIDKASSKLSGLKLAGIGVGVGAAAAVGGVLALGSAALKVGQQFDSAYDAIAIQTGATGKALDGLQASFKRVFSSVPADSDTVAAALATVNQRLGLTDKALEGVSTQFINLSRITGTDVKGNVDAAADVFARFNVEAADQPKLLDAIFKASQKSGVGFAELAGQMAGAAPQLKAAGLSAEQSAALVARLGKSGLDVGVAAGGINKFALSLAKSGDVSKPLNVQLGKVFEAIRGAGSEADARKIAFESFGRSGLAMGDAIRSGALDLAGLNDILSDSENAINGTASATDDFGQKLDTLKNKALVAFEPLGGLALDAANSLVDAITPAAESVIATVGAMVSNFARSLKDGEGFLSSFADALRAIGGDDTPGWIVATAAGLDGLSRLFDSTRTLATAMLGAFLGLRDADFSKLLDGTPLERFAGLFERIEDVVARVGAQFREAKIEYEKAKGGLDGVAAAAGVLLDLDVPGWVDRARTAWEPFGKAIDNARTAMQPWLDKIAEMFPLGDSLETLLKVRLAFAFGSVALAAGSAALGIIGALAPIVVPIAATSLAVLGLKKAWDTNFGGIQDKTESVIDFFNENWPPVRDLVVSVFDKIFDTASRVVNWFDTNLRPIFENVFGAVIDKLQQWYDKFNEAGGIKTVIGDIVDWFNAHVVPTWNHIWDNIMSVVQPIVDFLRQHMWEIRQIVQGAMDVIGGIIRVGWAIISGIFTIALDLLRGDWDSAWQALKDSLSGVWKGIQQAFGGLTDIFSGLGKILWSKAKEIGRDMMAGLKSGLQNAFPTVYRWLFGAGDEMVQGTREVLESQSPSKAFVRIGEDIVAGLRIGLQGIRKVADVVDEELGKIIGQRDVEQFEQIHRLTSALLGIFKDSADGIRALLNFDISVSAEQIRTAFDNLVGVFQEALEKMRNLAAGTGHGPKPGIPAVLLNMFDIMNIERWSGAVRNTIDVIKGTLDVIAQLDKTPTANRGAIAGLLPFLDELAAASKAFTGQLGADEDAREVFDRGAAMAASVAAFGKSLADLTSVKFGKVASTFAADIAVAADLTAVALDNVKRIADHWITTKTDTVARWLEGIRGYTEAAGAAVGLLKDSADLRIDTAMLATADQIAVAATVAERAGITVGKLATWWIGWGQEFRDNVLTGMKMYAEAAGAAIGLLRDAGALDLSKAVEATYAQLGIATRNAQRAESLLRGLADTFITQGEEWRGRVVPAMKEYADSAMAALSLLSAAASVTIEQPIALTLIQLGVAVRNAGLAETLLRGLANLYIEQGDTWRERVVPAMKEFADSASTALKLLTDAAGISTDWSKVSVIPATALSIAAENAEAARAEVQRLTEAWTHNLESAAMIVLVAHIKAWTETAGAGLKLLSDAAGLATDWSKVSIIPAQALSVAADNAKAALRAVQDIAVAWAKDMKPEDITALVGRVKGFADGANAALGLIGGVLKAVTDIATAAPPRLSLNVVTDTFALARGLIGLAAGWTRKSDEVDGKAIAALSSAASSAASLLASVNESVAKLEGAKPPRLALNLVTNSFAVARGLVSLAAGWVREADEVDAVAIGRFKDAADAAVGALVGVAKGLSDLSGLTVTSDPARLIAPVKAGARALFDALGELMTGPGGISAEVAEERARVALAAGSAAGGLSDVVDLITSAIESPFGRIRSRGKLGESHRAALSLRIKETLKSAVSAVNDALKELPTITIPDGLEDRLQRLADAFSPILDLIERLRDLRIDLRKLSDLAKACAILGMGGAGGAAGVVGGAGAGGGESGFGPSGIGLKGAPFGLVGRVGGVRPTGANEQVPQGAGALIVDAIGSMLGHAIDDIPLMVGRSLPDGWKDMGRCGELVVDAIGSMLGHSLDDIPLMSGQTLPTGWKDMGRCGDLVVDAIGSMLGHSLDDIPLMAGRTLPQGWKDMGRCGDLIVDAIGSMLGHSLDDIPLGAGRSLPDGWKDMGRCGDLVVDAIGSILGNALDEIPLGHHATLPGGWTDRGVGAKLLVDAIGSVMDGALETLQAENGIPSATSMPRATYRMTGTTEEPVATGSGTTNNSFYGDINIVAADDEAFAGIIASFVGA